MFIDCDSLRSVDKCDELSCLVDHHNPHVILDQEFWLSPDISTCLIFPEGLRPFRSDQVIGSGGIFILVRKDIDHALPDDNKDCESILVQLRLFNARLLIHSFFL